MKRFMLATVAGAALLAGATAASAQTFYNDGYTYQRGPMVERGVGLQVGPLSAGIYSDQPAYDRYGRSYRDGRDHSAYEPNAFRSQEVWPQSPPGGGY